MLSPDQFRLILVLLFWWCCSLSLSLSHSLYSRHTQPPYYHCIDCRKLSFYGSFSGCCTHRSRSCAYICTHRRSKVTLTAVHANIYTNRQWDFIVWNIICWGKFPSSFTFHFPNIRIRWRKPNKMHIQFGNDWNLKTERSKFMLFVTHWEHTIL